MKVLQYFLVTLCIYIGGGTWLYAIDVHPPTDILPSINEGAPGDSIAAIIAQGVNLTAVLAIIAITWTGVQMVLAVGEEEKMKKARHTMIYAFIGIVIAGLAYSIVNFVVNINLNSFF